MSRDVRSSETVLLVDPDPEKISAYAIALASVAGRVNAAQDFRQAKALLLSEPHDVLVTQVRLGEFNGLHLVLWAAMHIPDLRHVLIGYSPTRETILTDRELFFVQHSDEHAIVQATLEALARENPRRRWSRRALSSLPATINGGPAHLLDVGYGGFSADIDMPADTGSDMSLMVETPTAVTQVLATCRWSFPIDASRYRCGAHLSDDSSQAGSPWRAFVDQVSARPKRYFY